MKLHSLLVLALCAALPALAQESPRGEPKIERIVHQDDQVRIEELRVRGQTQRIVITPKDGKPYEIIVPVAGRDPGTNRGGQRGDAAGQRVWNVLSF